MNTLVVGWMLVTRRKVKSISGFRSKIRRIVSVLKKVAKIQSGVVAKLFSTSSSVELEMLISVASIMTGISDTQMDEGTLKDRFSRLSFNHS